VEIPTAGLRFAAPDEELLHAAALAADAGARSALDHFGRHELRQWFKDDGSRVTQADLAVEDAIRGALTRLIPGVPTLGEETGGNDTSGDRWIIDPIDGTENFSRGNPVWATLIAFESAGAITVATISAPALGHRWTAVRGAGAFADGHPIQVSERTDRGDATFCYGGLHECPTEQAIHRVLAAVRAFRCAWGWGNFWGHVQVAQGSAEAALSYGVELWDVAAPSLLVKEAGGRWTDAQGALDLLTGSLLTSNGHLHEVLISDLAEDAADASKICPGRDDRKGPQ
jgi:histidinol-phosphatase